MKTAAWSGTWTHGVVFSTRDGLEQVILERCYTIPGGRNGTINIFGWRPHVRKSREQLKYKSARACTGFVEEQRKYCGEKVR